MKTFYVFVINFNVLTDRGEIIRDCIANPPWSLYDVDASRLPLVTTTFLDIKSTSLASTDTAPEKVKINRSRLYGQS